MSRQTASFDRIGVALSGGLDSALVLAGLRVVSPEKEIHTFTAGFGQDDGEIIRGEETAKHFKTVHHVITLKADQLPSLIPHTVWHMEDAVGGEEMIYQFVAAREAARFVELVLTGHKADVQFGGMPRHKVMKLAMMLKPLRGPLEEFFHFTQMREMPGSWLGRLFVNLYFGTDRPFALSVLGAGDLPRVHPLPFEATQPLSEKLRRDILHGSSKLGATFQLHAAHGLYWNSPFMDAGVIETVFRIPDHLKIRGLKQKYILREACRGLVPETILNRKKSLQRLRHDRELSDVLDSLGEELLSPADVAARGIFVPGEVERVRRRPAGRIYPKEQAYGLWVLILTEIWARLYLDNRGRCPVV